jgi:beta-lactamase superfamily II metal-dependent hydrolase
MQGLYQRHKLVFATQLSIAILQHHGSLSSTKLGFLFGVSNKTALVTSETPFDWMDQTAWSDVQDLKVCIFHHVAHRMWFLT